MTVIKLVKCLAAPSSSLARKTCLQPWPGVTVDVQLGVWGSVTGTLWHPVTRGWFGGSEALQHHLAMSGGHGSGSHNPLGSADVGLLPELN